MIHLDILGASSDTLALIFEIIAQHTQKSSIRIIQNTSTPLESSFAISTLSYAVEQIEDINIQSLQNVVLGVYRTTTKRAVWQDFLTRFSDLETYLYNLIHPQSAIASTVYLAKGIQINPLVSIAPYSRIGKCVSINRNVSVGHHTTIGDFSTLNPGANVGGHCHIEESVTIGMGANIIEGIVIGANTIIGAGALVLKDVPANVVVMGSPAKIIRTL